MTRLYNTIRTHLSDLFSALDSDNDTPHSHTPLNPTIQPRIFIPQSTPPDIGEVRGQRYAKQALLIAAAGRHNLLMIGPPGEGKSFLASTISGFLPPLTTGSRTALQATYSALGLSTPTQPPIRSIGPTITLTSLIGGGRGEPIPGEVALAHCGVLFIDELPQFPRPLIDSLRSPLETRTVSVSRSGQAVTFPCDIQLIAAMNPCPCGYAGFGHCTCSDNKITQYLSHISGPILDRIDLVVRLDSLSSIERWSDAIPDQSRVFLGKVLRARCKMMLRTTGLGWNTKGPLRLNNELGANDVFSPHNALSFTPSALTHLKRITEGIKNTGCSTYQHNSRPYSTRKTVRLARVSRTVADLADSDSITEQHIAIAAGYVNQAIGETE